MFTVKTVSGFEMILEDAGKDSAGNQLWRQIKAGLGRRDILWCQDCQADYERGTDHRCA